MKTVFIDVDTQIDFMFPAGALYVPGAEKLLPNFARLTEYAAKHGIPIVSTADSHLEDDPEFKQWPPHCVIGTSGRQKAAATLAGKGAQQIVVDKRHIDVFEDSDLAAAIEQLNPGRLVVYGLVTEYCVRTAALGLIERTGKPVEIVTDAVKALSDQARDSTFAEFAARGGKLTTMAEVTV